ncbi:uncharacterized protein PFL1_00553 [Pseudozyma flocculosa PF-1]|uniref:Related to NTG2 - DNA N-glycosylase and apurinic/apyrimidinic (AP) lyase involved in base excision repair n=1 Tax=Pseudozyma flocculosa TaxID=84751 RepID=A0A5C3EUC6_9BASI|nr:uncharacterized protein PFL1_00553 [Pseudozyma flocculosa PF-1]EPQ32357.1 hypothetical protein PFL1_00553 [Pseudozyma flocculosa PF-1]SPO34679.1 related to NTG2 - DNA N-glycosylase and apurinic/apyrimidinic (AP) lyase involved in base excision repair [Pseudozyma flocculosa]
MPTRTVPSRTAAPRPTAASAAKPDAAPTRKRTRSSSGMATVTSPKLDPDQPPPPPPLSSAPKTRSSSSPKKARTTNNGSSVKVEEDEAAASTPPRATVKKEEQDIEDTAPASSPRKQTTSEKKLATYKASIQGSPFPDHPLPTAEEAERVAWILGEHHGYKRESEGGRGLPQYTSPKGENKWGGCGDVASVLDATIRTVLSCNTSNRNSSAAHRSLTERFGKQNWQAILDADESDVVDALRCGGLANNKTKTIRGILRETKERHGVLSLDHLHQATDDEIMQELVSFNGVGPKVASCVLAFCIGRQSMAVDTHVFRLCKSLGWVPEKANRDQTYYHLHERVPGHLKYPLHVLLIKHGKTCDNCSAKGFATVKEELPSSAEEGSADEGDQKPADQNAVAVKKEVKEEGDVPIDRSRGRPCPLKAAGLLGRRGKALKPKAEQDSKSDVKAEAGASATDESSPSSRRGKSTVKSEVKEEAMDVEEPSSAHEALEKAQAMSSDDLLKCIQKLRSTRSKNPLSESLKKKRYTLELSHGKSLSAEQRKRVFAIFEENMKSMYRNSTLGWKPADKKKELFHASSRFLIIRPPDVGAEIAGYVMWRFDTELCSAEDPLHPDRAAGGDPKEDGKLEISYLYEIQVSPPHQRAGLGRELMHLLYDLTAHLGLHKVMLTVFNQNKTAYKFYQSEGYEVDLISPSKDASMKDRVDYQIMSKPT